MTQQPLRPARSDPDGRRVAVCVATLRRPEGLRALLAGLAALAFEDPPDELRIVVVDNDAVGSAGAVCRSAKGQLPWPLDYCIEPRQGFAFARNRAVHEALGWANWIAFIDDDETPEPGWLDRLLAAQRAFAADVVGGPVLRLLPETVPAWVVRGGVFQMRRYPTGTVRSVAATNNVLTRAAVFEALDGPFAEGVFQTGGEDAYLYRRAAQAGFKIVWADDAVVYERIPESRATARALLRHAYRVGNNTSIADVLLDCSLRTRLRVAGGVAWRLVKGALFLPTGLLVGTRGFVRGGHHLAQAAGMVAGLSGREFNEYRDSHGCPGPGPDS